MKMRTVVVGMQNGRTGGSGDIKIEHMKLWLQGMREEEEDSKEKVGTYDDFLSNWSYQYGNEENHP